MEFLYPSPAYGASAAHALNLIGSRSAISGLLEAARDARADVALAALNAAIAIDEAGVADGLIELLHVDTTQRVRLARYFSTHRHPAAADALRVALEMAANDYERMSLEHARKHQH